MATLFKQRSAASSRMGFRAQTGGQAVSAVSAVRMQASELRLMNCKKKSLKESLWNFHQAPFRSICFGRLRQSDAALQAIPVGPGWHNEDN